MRLRLQVQRPAYGRHLLVRRVGFATLATLMKDFWYTVVGEGGQIRALRSGEAFHRDTNGLIHPRSFKTTESEC